MSLPQYFYDRPFRGQDAVTAGLLTRNQLRKPMWRRMFRDVYVSAACADSHALRAASAMLRLPPGAVVTGRSAAHLWGAGLAAPAAVEVLSPRPVRADGIVVRTGRVAPEETARVGTVTVPTPVHTAWEIARSRPLVEAVGWIDALARARGLHVVDLVRHADAHRGAHGSVRAARVLAMADPLAGSPYESRLRAHFHAGGLTGVVPRFTVSANGTPITRVDFAVPKIRLAIEHVGDRSRRLIRDRDRMRALTAVGWMVYPVTADDLEDIPALLDDLCAVVDRRTADLAAGKLRRHGRP